MISRQKKPRSIWGALLSIVLLLFACSAIYTAFYHNGPPVPGLEGFFNNPQFEVSDGSGAGLKEGYYVWTITNTGDFAWPKAYINFGPDHYAALGRVEPGGQASFSNAFLVSFETQQPADVLLTEGMSVEVRLVVDYAGEPDFFSGIKEMLGKTQERYLIGEVSR